MRKSFLKSLAGKLVLSIGGTMFLLGLLFSYVFIKLTHPDITLEQLFIYGGPFVILITCSLALILYHLVTKPISLLSEGMEKLAAGDMAYRIGLEREDELGSLAVSFNSMAEELMHYKEKMENWTKSLEEEVDKKAEEIVKAQENLINAEKLASLGRMAAGVAHELNSPLTGIVTFSYLMLDRMPPENVQDKEDLTVIIEQAERCSKIIKGLLGFSRKTTSEKSRVNINTLIDNTLMMMKNQTKFHNIVFDVRPEGLLPDLNIDPNQMQQVFVNLIINATDAMNKKGKVTIVTRLVEEEGRPFVEIEFSDTGPGIPDEIRARIFEPFFTTKPTGKGTGLGLAVSYGIIKKHNGRIFAQSGQGQGASFIIRLPSAAENPEAINIR